MSVLPRSLVNVLPALTLASLTVFRPGDANEVVEGYRVNFGTAQGAATKVRVRAGAGGSGAEGTMREGVRQRVSSPHAYEP